jgi:glutaredoxin
MARKPSPMRNALLCGVAAVVVAGGVCCAAAGISLRRQGRQSGLFGPFAADDSKDVQAKRLSPNFIESNPVPLATSQAAERFPATLYTFACGAVCQNAEALLNRRGVPFTTVNVEDVKGAEQLKKVTGDQQAPVLQLGDKLIAKGFNESRWQAMLDEAGYPKSAPRRVTTAKGAPEPPPPPPAAAPPEVVPVPGGGYRRTRPQADPLCRSRPAHTPRLPVPTGTHSEDCPGGSLTSSRRRLSAAPSRDRAPGSFSSACCGPNRAIAPPRGDDLRCARASAGSACA